MWWMRPVKWIWTSRQHLLSHHQNVLHLFRITTCPSLNLPTFDGPQSQWHISNHLHFICHHSSYPNVISSKLNSAETSIIKHLLSCFQVSFTASSIVQTLTVCYFDRWHFPFHLLPHYQLDMLCSNPISQRPLWHCQSLIFIHIWGLQVILWCYFNFWTSIKWTLALFSSKSCRIWLWVVILGIVIFLWKVSILKCTFTLLPRLTVTISIVQQLIGKSTIPSTTSYIFPSVCPVMSLYSFRISEPSWPRHLLDLRNYWIQCYSIFTWFQIQGHLCSSGSRIEHLSLHLCTTCSSMFVSWLPGVVVSYFRILAILIFLLASGFPKTGRRNSKWYVGHPEMPKFWTHPGLLAVYTSMWFLRALFQYGFASMRFWWTQL